MYQCKSETFLDKFKERNEITSEVFCNGQVYMYLCSINLSSDNCIIESILWFSG